MFTKLKWGLIIDVILSIFITGNGADCGIDLERALQTEIAAAAGEERQAARSVRPDDGSAPVAASASGGVCLV